MQVSGDLMQVLQQFSKIFWTSQSELAPDSAENWLGDFLSSLNYSQHWELLHSLLLLWWKRATSEQRLCDFDKRGDTSPGTAAYIYFGESLIMKALTLMMPGYADSLYPITTYLALLLKQGEKKPFRVNSLFRAAMFFWQVKKLNRGCSKVAEPQVVQIFIC